MVVNHICMRDLFAQVACRIWTTTALLAFSAKSEILYRINDSKNKFILNKMNFSTVKLQHVKLNIPLLSESKMRAEFC